jgi:hypothetical protein
MSRAPLIILFLAAKNVKTNSATSDPAEASRAKLLKKFDQNF